MIVVLSTYGSRGDVEPIVALAVQLGGRDEEFTRLLSAGEKVGIPHRIRTDGARVAASTLELIR